MKLLFFIILSKIFIIYAAEEKNTVTIIASGMAARTRFLSYFWRPFGCYLPRYAKIYSEYEANITPYYLDPRIASMLHWLQQQDPHYHEYEDLILDHAIKFQYFAENIRLFRTALWHPSENSKNDDYQCMNIVMQTEKMRHNYLFLLQTEWYHLKIDLPKASDEMIQSILSKGRQSDILQRMMLLQTSGHMLLSECVTYYHTLYALSCHDLERQFRDMVLWILRMNPVYFYKNEQSLIHQTLEFAPFFKEKIAASSLWQDEALSFVKNCPLHRHNYLFLVQSFYHYLKEKYPGCEVFIYALLKSQQVISFFKSTIVSLLLNRSDPMLIINFQGHPFTLSLGDSHDFAIIDESLKKKFYFQDFFNINIADFTTTRT